MSLTAPIIAILIGALILGKIRSEPDQIGWQALLVGAGAFAIIGLVPVVNVIAAILSVLFGFGAWILYLHRRYTAAKETYRI